MLEVGSVLDGKYKILNEIGRGGMSVVYLALNERANKTWAVKEVRKDGGNDSEVLSQGLIAETEMLKKLSHPNLPAIIDVIDREDTFIIVMDYIEGKDLQKVLNHGGAQNPDDVIEWTKQLCDVLGYLHGRRPPIIYRDMKPANVMLRPNGQVALLDFGTAREYKEHSQGDTTWLGTRGYAAPEQFGGRGQTDARTDIYCLGATMYHLLTGYSPADTQFVIYPIGQLRPELAGSGLEKVVMRCCQPEPANRFQSCAELMYALEHVHDDDEVVLRSRRRKWRAFLTAAGISLLGVAGMITFSSLQQSAKNKSYDSCISQAQNSSSLEDKEKYYKQAISLQPDNAQAYVTMLEDISSDNNITTEEKTAFEHCINDTHASTGGTLSNMTVLQQEEPEDYAEVQYEMGRYYFACSDSLMKEANTCMNLAVKSEKLAVEKKGIANSVIVITKPYVEAKVDNDYLGGDFSYGDYWTELYALVGDSAVQSIDANTGNKSFSLALFRTAVAQIVTNVQSYKRAGVSQEQLQQVLNNAKSYCTGVLGDESQPKYHERAQTVLNNAEQAQHILDNAFR